MLPAALPRMYGKALARRLPMMQINAVALRRQRYRHLRSRLTIMTGKIERAIDARGSRDATARNEGSGQYCGRGVPGNAEPARGSPLCCTRCSALFENIKTMP